MKHITRLLAVTTLALSAPTLMADDARDRAWGARIGLADDPDQVVVGLQLDLGEVGPQVRLVPNVELGLGDDRTIVTLTAPVVYRWEELRETDVVPYAGGGVTAGWVDRDGNGRGRDDSDFELAARAIGGAEWRLESGRAFFVELHLVFGDLHDTQLVAGWRLGRRGR